MRAKEGQICTPQSAVNWIVELLDPRRRDDRAIDPVRGAGSFLNFTLRHLLRSGAAAADVANSPIGVYGAPHYCEPVNTA